MMELPDKIKRELDYIQNNNKVLFFSEDGPKWNKLEEVIHYVTEEHEKFTLVRHHESISDSLKLDRIYELIDKFPNNEIKISASTSTPLYRMFDPLTNIFFWRGSYHINTYKGGHREIVVLFKEGEFQNNFDKSNKGILSVRKETLNRNYIFRNINQEDFEGIIRYIKYETVKDEYINLNPYKYPTLVNLINEYEKSYVSFVPETEGGFTTPISEKTFISFLTKTMPVFHGHCSFLRQLKEMGFYFFNEEFGYDISVDTLDQSSRAKLNQFINSINNYNKLSLSDIKNLYEKNIDKIEHNYNLISTLILGDFNYIDVGHKYQK
jgi:hypothetical protein